MRDACVVQLFLILLFCGVVVGCGNLRLTPHCNWSCCVVRQYFCPLVIADVAKVSCVLSLTYQRYVALGDSFVSLPRSQSVLFVRMASFIQQD